MNAVNGRENGHKEANTPFVARWEERRVSAPRPCGRVHVYCASDQTPKGHTDTKGTPRHPRSHISRATAQYCPMTPFSPIGDQSDRAWKGKQGTDEPRQRCAATRPNIPQAPRILTHHAPPSQTEPLDFFLLTQVGDDHVLKGPAKNGLCLYRKRNHGGARQPDHESLVQRQDPTRLAAMGGRKGHGGHRNAMACRTGRTPTAAHLMRAPHFCRAAMGSKLYVSLGGS